MSNAPLAVFNVHNTHMLPSVSIHMPIPLTRIMAKDMKPVLGTPVTMDQKHYIVQTREKVYVSRERSAGVPHPAHGRLSSWLQLLCR